jgi:hypothetical protein
MSSIKLQFSIIYHTFIIADLPKVTFTIIKTPQLSGSEMYANFTKPVSIKNETGIFTTLKFPR